MTGLLRRVVESAFALGLLAYPAAWRSRSGPEVRRAFSDQCADVLRRRGALGLIRLGLATPWHLARGAWRERVDPVRATASEARIDREGMMRGVLQDVRFALRALRRDPGFALVAVGLLAAGIGATTGIFSAANALLLRPLPGIAQPRDVVALGLEQRRSRFSTFPYPLYEQIRDGVAAFDGAVIASARLSLDLRTADETRKAGGELVSGNYFSALGVRMARGRGFTEEETAVAGGPLVTVLSHATWVGLFGSDPGIVGRVVSLNGSPFTVVGVAEADFQGTSFSGGAPELWVPMSTQPVTMPADWSPLTSMGDFWLALYARMAPGVSVEQARSEMDALAAALREAYPAEAEGLGFVVTGRLAVPNPAVRERLGRTLGMLLGAVTLLLLIVCANLANLSLGRAVARRREVGIRVALGAGKERVFRQLLAESVTLSLVGGVAGLLVAGRLTEVVLGLARVSVPPPASLDVLVGVFALGLSLITGAVFGIMPAVASAGVGAGGLSGTRATGERGGTKVRRALAVGQVALSTTLLVVSALFARSLRNMQDIELGFDPDGVLVAALDMRARGTGAEEGLTLYGDLIERLRALPGVDNASLVLNAPLSGSMRGGGIRVEGRPELGEDGVVDSSYNQVLPGYFATMGIPLVRGRDFTDRDDAGAPPVAIVSESFASWIWPGQDPLGRRFGRPGPEAPWIEVVGVVADSKFGSLDEEPMPFFFLPMRQRYDARARLVVRAKGEPTALVAAVREEMRRIDPGVPLFSVGTLRAQVRAQTSQFRLTASLTGAFSTMAVVLSALGLYALLSYGVSRRRREIGLRMALGAQARVVTGMVTREALTLTVAGLALGVLGGVAAGRLTRSMLYGVGAVDPGSLGVTALVLAAIGVAASWAPARRASRVDPMEALRIE